MIFVADGEATGVGPRVRAAGPAGGTERRELVEAIERVFFFGKVGGEAGVSGNSLLRVFAAGGGVLGAYGGAGVVLVGVFSWGPGRSATWLVAKSAPREQ